MKTLTTIQEIKQAVDQGKEVYADSALYKVEKNKYGQYYIKCTSNGHCIGLTGHEGTAYENQLNGFSFFTI